MFNFEMDFNRLLAGALQLMLGRVTLGLSKREEGRNKWLSVLLGLAFLAAGTLYVFSSGRAWFGEPEEDEEEF